MCTVPNYWQHPPTLSGSHVLLRPTTLDDLPGLITAHDDPHMLQYFPYGTGSEPPSWTALQQALESERQVLTQIDVTTGNIVGTTSLYNMDPLHKRVTIGHTWVTSTSRGSAINPQAKLLLLDHIFDELTAVRAEFYVDELNTISRHAVQALGAQHEGCLRRHARRRDGSWRTTIVYAITDEDWPTVREKLVHRIQQRS